MSKARNAGLLVAVIGLALVFATGARPVVYSQLHGHLPNKWYGNQAAEENIWLPDDKAVIQAQVSSVEKP
jgi:hypothetical protein